jgi:hypothetical protein
MRTLVLIAAVALSGCATSYQLAVMPRDSGKVYSGTAEDNGRGEGRMSIAIEDKTYNGTWVQMSPDHTSAYVSGGLGFGRRWGGMGTIVTLDNPQGTEAKALLSSADGAGLRCDFKSGQGRGGGLCRDDRGREYDVQIRPASRG